MKSMTGYAYKEFRDESVSLALEIKGYNNRFLELFINLPPFLSMLESRIRDYVASRCERGKIELSLRLKELATDVSISIDKNAAQAYYKAILELAGTLNIDEKPKLHTILGMEGVLQIDKIRDPERYWAVIEPILKSAMDQFEAERIREGKATEADILGHIAVLEGSVAVVEQYTPTLEAQIKDNLRSRFAELLGDSIDENRILAETAVLLMKYTISEEIARLKAHLAEFKAEIERNPAPGKKLDFLCQEINREVNTIGSKSPILEVSRAVVAMKDALENVREQLRNVE
uniref:YicC family protein n=1 Tax=Gracilinema caldarium TaxID=215591 RepID=A0A7C3IGL7_9SPIR